MSARLPRTALGLLIVATTVGLTGTAREVGAGPSVRVTREYKTSNVQGKAAQVARLHAHVSDMIATLGRNPQRLSKDVIKSLKLRLRAFERAGVKAIEEGGDPDDGGGELRLWEAKTDQPQHGASLQVGRGANQRYRSINIASAPDSTAVTESVRASGRKRLEDNQVVAEETWFRGGGRRRDQTSLYTFARYPGGGVAHSSYRPLGKTKADAEPHFGSTLDMSGKRVVVTHFVQPDGEGSPRRRVLSTDSASKAGLAGSWTSAEIAAGDAAKAIDAIVGRGADAEVSWRELDEALGAILGQIDQAERSIRDGAEIFAVGGGKARPARMTPLVAQGNSALRSLARARAQVARVYDPVHDRLGFIAGSELSRLLGDGSAPAPRTDGTVPAWAIDSLAKASSELKGTSSRRIRAGGEILTRSL